MVNVRVGTFRMGLLDRLRAGCTGKVHVVVQTYEGQLAGIDVTTRIPQPVHYMYPLPQQPEQQEEGIASVEVQPEAHEPRISSAKLETGAGQGGVA
ncbi:hypothetical protein [Paenibacillus sp. y28]|uniref:hypothetical protein n=1 Tax=Paenibacillus sp. y28 TaxID=3129110 RepID=UPI00301AABF5